MKTAREVARELADKLEVAFWDEGLTDLSLREFEGIVEYATAAIEADRLTRPTREGDILQLHAIVDEAMKKPCFGPKEGAFTYQDFADQWNAIRAAIEADRLSREPPRDDPRCTCEVFTQDDRNCPRHQGSLYREKYGAVRDGSLASGRPAKEETP